MPDLAKAEKRFDDLVSSAERTLRVGRSRPFFFGPADRPLAGYLHLPEDGWNGTRVLLCPPLGYEALLSYLTLRETAAQLAARTNAMVMHFDYDGSGDSAGTDEDPGRVAAWLASVKHALEYVKAVSPEPGPVVLVGLRAGALLAAHAAAGRTDIAGLALWAPCATGKAFLREQRAFSNLTTSNRPGKEKATAGLDANGFVFTDETMAALEVLRMADLAEPVSPNVLVLQRAEMRTPQAVPKSWTNSVVEEQTTTDYPRMMEPPWLWESPTASISVLADWITRLSPASKTVVSVREGATTATVAPGVRETALFFGKAEHRFGILSAPAESASGEAVLLVTSTFGYRIGPNRMNVAFARRFAAVGTAVLRIDVNGVGDSREGVGTPPPGPYDPAAIDDVCAALVLLKRMGYRRITMSGVCAGAFLAWAAAERAEVPVELILVNLETFDVVPYNRELMTKFENPPPPFRERLKTAKNRLEEASVIWSQLRKWRNVSVGVLNASAPTTFRSSTLGARIQRLTKSGSRIHLIYSSHDPGLRHYYLRTALHHLRFLLRGAVTVQIIDGPDHSFTPRWATNLLGETILKLLRPEGARTA